MNWNPAEILDLKKFKEAVIFTWYTFTLCKLDVKFMGNSEQDYSTRLKRLSYRNIDFRSSLTMENMMKRGSYSDRITR